MARTKQTSQRSKAGKSPRKCLPSIGRKRELSDDECDEIDKKRMKLNTNSNTSEYQNVSSESDGYQVENQDDDISNSLQLKMDLALKSVKTIFDSNCSISHLLTFTKKLHSITKTNKAKFEELTYRKQAIASLRNRYQERIGKKSHLYKYWSSNQKQYFNKNIFHFIKTNVKGLRFCEEQKREEYDYDFALWTDYSLDVALKTKHPHQKYSNVLHGLLGKYISDMTDISRIISEYSHNGYQWYRLQVSEQVDADECWQGFTNGILYDVPFDLDDYFRNNKYYKAKTSGGETIPFKRLREELKSKSIYNMSNADLSCFIVAIWSIEFDSELLDDCQDWIEKQHG